MKSTTQKICESISSIRDDLEKIEAHILSGASLDVSESIQDLDNRAHLAWIVCDEERMEDAAHQEHNNFHRAGMV